jgi:hypothetical protein
MCGLNDNYKIGSCLNSFGEIAGILEADKAVSLGLVAPLVSHHCQDIRPRHIFRKGGPFSQVNNLPGVTEPE